MLNEAPFHPSPHESFIVSNDPDKQFPSQSKPAAAKVHEPSSVVASIL